MAEQGRGVERLESYGQLGIPIWRGADGSMAFAHGTPEMDAWLKGWEGVLKEVESRLAGTPPTTGG